MTLTKRSPSHKIYHIIPKFVLPSAYNIKDLNSFEIYDQEQKSDCVAFATKFLTEYSAYNKTGRKFDISVCSLYYEARHNDEITYNDDDYDPNTAKIGTSVYAGIYVLNKGFSLNMPKEPKIWPNVLIPPSDYAFTQKYNLDLTYGLNLFSVKRDVNDIKYYLIFNLPIIFSLCLDNINDHFSKIKSDILKPTNSSSYRGHCLVIVGYNDNYNGNKVFLCRNSYGQNFGVDGYFYLDQSFLTYYNSIIDDYLMNDMYVII